MTVGELIYKLKTEWNLSDEVVVKQGDIEYDIVGVSEYADYHFKEGGSSPAILIGE